jgi:phosphocarrier protein
MDQGPGTTVVKRVEVLNAAGLHARPAAVLAEHAKSFQSDIALVLAEVPADLGVEIGTRVDAKSVMDVLFLAAPQGTRIDIEASGPDAEQAVEDLETLFGDQFGIA